MMKQVFEEPEQQKLPAQVSTTPPAQTAVTPKEFAEAVASIENQRAAKSQTTETVNVGDAIQQLGLSVRADEVLSVIEYRRAEELRRIQQLASRRRRVVNVIGKTVLALSLLLNVYLLSPLHGSAPPAAAGVTVVQGGTLHSISGQSGTVHFPQPYRYAPNVEILDEGQFGKTRVTHITNSDFTWENTSTDPTDIFNNADMPWKAEGVR
ncbi:MAG TPA: hypothetical protein VKU00_27730 [Chthonomonadaceae bacterium]|nr:hypothetical protein [Chthonomonadaceae bacterium]